MAFIGILTLVDDFGQCDARPAVLCAECFAVWNEFHPEERVDCAGLCRIVQDLADIGMIEIYDHKDGSSYLQVVQWQERVRENARKKWTGEGFVLRNPAQSCTILLPKPPPSPLTIAHAHAREGVVLRLHGIPETAEQVIDYGKTIQPKIDERRCREFFNHYEGQARTNQNGQLFWVTGGENGTVITNWKMKLPAFRGSAGGFNGEPARAKPDRPKTTKHVLYVKYNGIHLEFTLEKKPTLEMFRGDQSTFQCMESDYEMWLRNRLTTHYDE